MKNLMDKYFKRSVFAEFKRETVDVTTDIAKHLVTDTPTPDKSIFFAERKPKSAEVIKLIEAHLQTVTLPMIKTICANVDDLLHAIKSANTAKDGATYLLST